MKKENWVWMPHPGHLIVGHECRFHLSTYVGDYIVSTVGEWWPDAEVRRIHAKVVNPTWYKKNGQLKGDFFDRAYEEKFGFMELGINRTYETMVFKAGKKVKESCCPYMQESGESIDMNGYTEAKEAYKGHLEMCEKWSTKGEDNGQCKRTT